MSPQPAAAPTVETDPYAELRKRIDAIDPDKRTSAQRQFVRANLLEQRRGDVMREIAANREYLRLMDANDELDEELGDWLEDFYPVKEKGETRSADEIERTRQAKAAARGKK